MKNYYLLPAFLLLSGLSIVAYARNDNQLDIDEYDYIGEVANVLSVSRLSQPVSDAPSAVTVIDRATIRASGIVDLPEIFRLVPGFYVGANAGFVHNTNHAVSYHGMTSAYSGSMQVLIDGRSVYNPLYGGVQWSELPLTLDEIESIEVTRGPNAASYGANSYFGVINIITQSAAELKGNSAIATHGNGRNQAFYRYGNNLGALNYRVTTGYRQDDGLDNRNDFKRTRFLNARADYQFNVNNNLEFLFGILDGARGEGNIERDSLLFLPRTKKINHHHQLVRWTHNLSEDSDFILQAYHSFDRSNDKTTSVNLRPLLGVFGPLLLNDTVTVFNPVETERYDIEAQHNFAVGQSLRFVWGGSIRRDSLYAPYYLGTKEKDYFDLQRLFGHAEWHVSNKVLFNAGAMVEHNDFTGTDISPRASLNFKINPNHTLRFGISSALRTASYVEEKFDIALLVPTIGGNPPLLYKPETNAGGLDPEKIISKEVGYLGQIGNINIDARLFYDKISDHIRLSSIDNYVPPPGVILIPGVDNDSAENSGSAEVNGFESQIKWRINKKTNLLLNYAHVRIRKTKERLTRDLTLSMPSNTISALLTHRFNHQWDGSVAYYQTSEATLLGDGDNVDLIRKCDVRLARRFDYGKLRGEVSGVIENLFNTHYEEFADYNTAKRRARINIKLDF